MSRLRAAADAFARSDRHALLATERLFAVERIAAGLEARRTVGGESLAALAERTTGALSVGELRRLVLGIWVDRAKWRLAAPLVARALDAGWRSLDRALIEAYLLHYPTDHPAFEALRAAATHAAGRHDWRWRETAERWRLRDGPAALGTALAQAPDPVVLLRAAGFAGRFAGGAFVRAARAGAARSGR